jgi:hypothetical protein
MATGSTENTILDDDSPGDLLVAHVILKSDQLRGYVRGEPVLALCGEEFVPTRDPEKFPECWDCRIALRDLLNKSERKS